MGSPHASVDFRSVVDASTEATFVAGGDGRLVYVNRAACGLLDASPADLLGRSFGDLVAEDTPRTDPMLLDALLDGHPAQTRRRLARVHGGTVDVELRLRHLPGGLRLALARDLGTKAHEEELRRSERRLLSILDNTSEMLALLRVEPGDRFVFEVSNRAYLEAVAERLGLFPRPGDERGELLRGRGAPAEAVEYEQIQFRRAITTRAPVRYEFGAPLPDGVLFLDILIAPLFGENGEVTHVLWSGRDLSARKRVEERLSASLREKEALLREIHHRVKNNLQVVSSLLYLQAARFPTPAVSEVFRDCQARVGSMALIHELLYRSSDLSRIPFGEYVRSLAHTLGISYGISAGRVALTVDAADVELGLTIAVPCGLVLNELLTNALKHAFPEERTGRIAVSLERLEAPGALLLRVCDDGVGLPPDYQDRAASALGMQLVERLVDQIDGRLERTSPPAAFPDAGRRSPSGPPASGTCFRIEFRDPDPPAVSPDPGRRSPSEPPGARTS